MLLPGTMCDAALWVGVSLPAGARVMDTVRGGSLAEAAVVRAIRKIKSKRAAKVINKKISRRSLKTRRRSRSLNLTRAKIFRAKMSTAS